MKNIKKQVLHSLRQHAVPMMIGAPGVGKTSFGVALARELGADCFVVCLSHKEPTEIHGQPVVAREQIEINGQRLTVVQQAPPDYALAAATSERPVLIVYDELTTVSPNAAAPVLAILQEAKIGDIQLDRRRVGFIACANPPELAAGGWELPPPTANRLRWFEFKVEPMAWVEDFPAYWGQPPVLGFAGQEISEDRWATARAKVAAFIRSKPDALLVVPKAASDRSGPWPSPRSWDRVSRTLADCDGFDGADLFNAVAGDVGEPMAKEFTAWLDSIGFFDPELFFAGRLKPEKPERPDIGYYMTVATGEYIRNLHNQGRLQPELWERAWEVFRVVKEAGMKDVAVVGVRRIVKFRPPKSRIPQDVHDLYEFQTQLDAAGVGSKK